VIIDEVTTASRPFKDETLESYIECVILENGCSRKDLAKLLSISDSRKIIN